MPLVDDMVNELESHQWLCLLNAASRFWAVLMTEQARHLSAFVCSLGHFEWLRMPLGHKNDYMIYQQLIDNSLWGYAQPQDWWQDLVTKVKVAVDVNTSKRATETTEINELGTGHSTLTIIEADYRVIDESDPLESSVNDLAINIFVKGEPDGSTVVLVFSLPSFVGDICFGGKSFDECLASPDRLLVFFDEVSH